MSNEERRAARVPTRPSGGPSLKIAEGWSPGCVASGFLWPWGMVEGLLVGGRPQSPSRARSALPISPEHQRTSRDKAKWKPLARNQVPRRRARSLGFWNFAVNLIRLLTRKRAKVLGIDACSYVDLEGGQMWRNQHKRRVKAKGVARSGAYDVDIRGEIGRRSRTSPGYVVAEAIREALNPASAPGKVKRWQDMTEAERAALRAQYEKGPKR